MPSRMKPYAFWGLYLSICLAFLAPLYSQAGVQTIGGVELPGNGTLTADSLTLDRANQDVVLTRSGVRELTLGTGGGDIAAIVSGDLTVQGTLTSSALVGGPRTLEAVTFEASIGDDRTHTVPGGTWIADGDVIEMQFTASRQGAAPTLSLTIDGNVYSNTLDQILNAVGEEMLVRVTMQRTGPTEMVVQHSAGGESDEVEAFQKGYTVDYTLDIDIDITAGTTVAIGAGWLRYWPAP